MKKYLIIKNKSNQITNKLINKSINKKIHEKENQLINKIQINHTTINFDNKCREYRRDRYCYWRGAQLKTMLLLMLHSPGKGVNCGATQRTKHAPIAPDYHRRLHVYTFTPTPATTSHP